MSKMSAAARSLAVFAVYLIVSGFSLMFIPNTVLQLLGLPTTTEVWIRVVGTLTVIIGTYFVQAARFELRPFFWASIWGRLIFCMAVVSFALLQLGSGVLLLFGLIDLAGAAWTFFSLRSQPRTT